MLYYYNNNDIRRFFSSRYNDTSFACKLHNTKYAEGRLSAITDPFFATYIINFLKYALQHECRRFLFQVSCPSTRKSSLTPSLTNLIFLYLFVSDLYPQTLNKISCLDDTPLCFVVDAGRMKIFV